MHVEIRDQSVNRVWAWFTVHELVTEGLKLCVNSARKSVSRELRQWMLQKYGGK
jgi:hypothetical protein